MIFDARKRQPKHRNAFVRKRPHPSGCGFLLLNYTEKEEISNAGIQAVKEEEEEAETEKSEEAVKESSSSGADSNATNFKNILYNINCET